MINIKKSYAGNLLFRVKDCLQRGEMEPRNIFCLGCAVKVPLKTVLYPAIRKIKKVLSGRNIRIETGNDGYIFESNKNISLKYLFC